MNLCDAPNLIYIYTGEKPSSSSVCCFLDVLKFHSSRMGFPHFLGSHSTFYYDHGKILIFPTVTIKWSFKILMQKAFLLTSVWNIHIYIFVVDFFLSFKSQKYNNY